MAVSSSRGYTITRPQSRGGDDEAALSRSTDSFVDQFSLRSSACQAKTIGAWESKWPFPGFTVKGATRRWRLFFNFQSPDRRIEVRVIRRSGGLELHRMALTNLNHLCRGQRRFTLSASAQGATQRVCSESFVGRRPAARFVTPRSSLAERPKPGAGIELPAPVLYAADEVRLRMASMTALGARWSR